MGRPVEHHEPRIQTGFRLTGTTRDRLVRFCTERLVGRDLVAERALVEFLDRHTAVDGAEPLDWAKR